jgi:hypothetical protein
MLLRVFPITLVFAIMTASIALGQGSSGGESGIEGVITITPAQPGPIRADSPASKPLPNTHFVVEDQNGEVTSFTTDEQGHFRITLAPGHYKVALKGKRVSIGRFGPFDAEVVAGKMTKVQWECDSGIR